MHAHGFCLGQKLPLKWLPLSKYVQYFEPLFLKIDIFDDFFGIHFMAAFCQCRPVIVIEKEDETEDLELL